MAARAGLTAGDILVSISGHQVHDLRTLAAALRYAGHAATVELIVQRDGVNQVVHADVVAVPPEPDARYGVLPVDGARLRTILTCAEMPRALVLVIQGIACESVDHALDLDAPLATLVHGWTRAGYDTFRFDKRGVGDSEGSPCAETDFETELADVRAAVEKARETAWHRDIPLVAFGHSVGGIIAAQLASSFDAIVVYGTPVMRWLDCLVDSVERQLTLRGASAAEIERERAAIENLATAGELNGRSAAYHRQLHALDLEAAWRAVDVPVLVLRGEHDWVVRADDQARIAELARGPTTIEDLEGLDHLFGAHADRAASLRDYGVGKADRSIIDATVAWLDRLRLRV